MSPKEITEETLVTQMNQQTGVMVFRDKVFGTPLERLPDGGILELERRHGWACLLWATDTVVTAWRKRGFTIVNPGGYLHSVCQEYDTDGTDRTSVSTHEPAAVVQENTSSENFQKKAYWQSLDVIHQQQWIAAARESVTFEWNMSDASASAIACAMAWDAMLHAQEHA